ncbi:cyclin-like protein [Auricularia subglabra TFB-10046 SS5]|nr:cyclin-like protein [Auricularia subglabra TFB-10046 SS5]
MSQWVFDLAHLFKTPSQEEDGWVVHTELQDRNKGVDFLFRVGLSLNLSLTPLYTAATYLHRFYMRHSLEDYNWHEVAMACLYLASKIEETSRKIADTARMAMVKARQLDPDRYNFKSEESLREIERWQGTILAREELLVDTLCFEFVVRHPQAHLAHLFHHWPQQLDPDDTDFLHGATWTVANDAFRTPICIVAEPHVAALAIFLVAAHTAGLPSIADFFALLNDGPDACAGRESETVLARDLLDVDHRDLTTVHDCMTLLRDYYASTLEQAGRYAFIDDLASLPLPNDEVKFFPPCPPGVQQNGSTNGTNGHLGDRTPQSDGSKTPGAYSSGSKTPGAFSVGGRSATSMDSPR